MRYDLSVHSLSASPFHTPLSTAVFIQDFRKTSCAVNHARKDDSGKTHRTHSSRPLAIKARSAMHATVQDGYVLSRPSALHPRFAAQTDENLCPPDSAVSPPLSHQNYAMTKATTINNMWTRVRSIDCITAAAVASKWPLSPSKSLFPASPNVHTSFLLPATP